MKSLDEYEGTEYEYEGTVKNSKFMSPSIFLKTDCDTFLVNILNPTAPSAF